MIQEKKLSRVHMCAFHNFYTFCMSKQAWFRPFQYINWEIQKGIYSYLDISIELWGLNLFTSVTYY